MSLSFDPTQALIVVPARLRGPAADGAVRLALDTGATWTTLNWDLAVLLGYDPEAAASRVQVVAASKIEFLPQIQIDSITALDRERRGFSVLCHALPPSATVDGLLGLDFFRDQRLVIDFRKGQVTVD